MDKHHNSSGNHGNIDWDLYESMAIPPIERPSAPKGYDSTECEVPTGVYRLEITNVGKWISDDQRKMSHKISVRITDKSIWSGRKFALFFYYEHPADSVKIKGITKFCNMCRAVGLANLKNTTELIGKEFIGQITMSFNKKVENLNKYNQPFANYFTQEVYSVPEFKDTHKQTIPNATPTGTKYESDIIDEGVKF